MSCQECGKPYIECQCIDKAGFHHHDLPETLQINLICPHCHEKQGRSGYASRSDRLPEPNDRTVCTICWEFLIFTETGFRAVTPEELEQIEREDDPIVQAVLEIRRNL